jgi:hypothetical protein
MGKTETGVVNERSRLRALGDLATINIYLMIVPARRPQRSARGHPTDDGRACHDPGLHYLTMDVGGPMDTRNDSGRLTGHTFSDAE